jgi:hypothetical protein
MDPRDVTAIKKGLESIHGSLQDLTDAILTLAISRATASGLQSAEDARKDVMDIFDMVSMGGKD